MFSFTKENNNIVARTNKGKLLYLYDIYEIPQKLSKKESENYFESCELEDNDFFRVVPETRPKHHDVVVLCSMPGAGKTTFIKNYIDDFFKLFPEAENAVLFTSRDEENKDEGLESVLNKINYITIDESIIDDPIEISDLRTKNEEGEIIPRLIIADDYENLEKKIANSFFNFLQKCIKNGRKDGIYVLIANTVIPISGNVAYANILSNCTKFIYFPRKEPSNLTYVLNKYFGINERIFTTMRNFYHSRWLAICGHGEQMCFISETNCVIFNALEMDDRVKKIQKYNNKLIDLDVKKAVSENGN